MAWRADAEKAARRLMEHANAFVPIQDGRIYIENVNGPFLFGGQSTPTLSHQTLTNVPLSCRSSQPARYRQL